MVPAFIVDVESNVPKRAQTTLAGIINEHPEGLDVASVGEYYQQKNGYHIEPCLWGFRSLSDVTNSLKNIFRGVQCKNGNMRFFAAFLPAGNEEKRLLADPFDATPEFVKNRLRKIVTANAIYQDELLGIYNNKFQERLKYDAYGYDTLPDFVKAQTGTTFCTTVNDGRVLLTAIPVPDNSKSVTTYTLEKLKQMDRKRFPPDCVSPHDHLANISKSIFTPFKEIRIHINDPINFTYLTGFHFNLVDYAKQYEELTQNMTNFYEENKDKYILPEWAAVEHIYCAAPLFGKWLRLQILENHGCEVVCLLLDFGIFNRFPKKDLHYIHSEFAKLPCQTFEGKLAFCIPPEKINREAEKYFEKKIKGVVPATVVRVDDSEYVELLLYVNDVDFLSLLVKKNFAKRSGSEMKKGTISDDDEVMAVIASSGTSEFDGDDQIENSSNANECHQPIAMESDTPSNVIKNEKMNDSCAKTEKIGVGEAEILKCLLKTEEKEAAKGISCPSDILLRSSTPMLPSTPPDNRQMCHQEAPVRKQTQENKSLQNMITGPPVFYTAAPVLGQSHISNSNYNLSMPPPGFAPLVRNAAPVLVQSPLYNGYYNFPMPPPGFGPAVGDAAPFLGQPYLNNYCNLSRPPGLPLCPPGFVSPMCMHLLGWAQHHSYMSCNRAHPMNLFSVPASGTGSVPVAESLERTMSAADETELHNQESKHFAAEVHAQPNKPELKDDALNNNSGAIPKTEERDVEVKPHVGISFSKDVLEEDYQEEYDVRVEKARVDGEKFFFEKILINGRPYLSVAEVCNKMPLMPSVDDLLYDSLILIAKDEEPRLWRALKPVVSKHTGTDDEIFLIPFDMLLRLIMSSTTVPEPAVIKLFNLMQQHCRK